MAMGKRKCLLCHLGTAKKRVIKVPYGNREWPVGGEKGSLEWFKKKKGLTGVGGVEQAVLWWYSGHAEKNKESWNASPRAINQSPVREKKGQYANKWEI